MRTTTALITPLLLLACGGDSVAPAYPHWGSGPAEVVVRLLDVGLGDAIYIENGASRVFIDGGPNADRLGQHLDALGLSHTTLDAVILTHVHADHHRGLQALFESSRGLDIRLFFENGDRFESTTLDRLRDSVAARVARGGMTLRDTDDPCGTGAPICTLLLDGGAKLHVLRPNPAGSTPNDRSVAVKLVGPDSASFTMWLAGDAEHEALDWFESGAGYHLNPGMRVRVLKGNHHGNCDGITSRHLQRTAPEAVVFSFGDHNPLGYVHTQVKDLLRARGVSWYRTDTNGTLTIRSPGTRGGGYTIGVERGRSDMELPTDRTSPQSICRSL